MNLDLLAFTILLHYYLSCLVTLLLTLSHAPTLSLTLSPSLTLTLFSFLTFEPNPQKPLVQSTGSARLGKFQPHRPKAHEHIVETGHHRNTNRGSTQTMYDSPLAVPRDSKVADFDWKQQLS